MQRFGKQSVFWKWIVSYISVVLIMVVFNLISYARNWEIMKDRQNQMNLQVLQQMSERIYDNVLQLEKIRERILANSNYAFLCRASKSQYKSLAYRRYVLWRDVRDYQAVSGTCSKIIIHFEEGDYLISSDNVCDSRRYFMAYQKELGLSWEEWQELLNTEYPVLYMKKTSTEDGQGIVYARTIQTGQTGYQQINALFVYTAEDVKKMLASHQGEDVYSAALRGKNGEVVLLDLGEFLTEEADQALAEEAIRQKETIITLSNKEELKFIYEESMLAGICLLSPENVYLESIRKSQQMFVVTFAITIISSMALIILYARRNYKPLQELLDVLGPEEWVSVQYKNEFAMVRDKVSMVQNENKNVNLTLRRQNRLFRTEYFAKLLTGNMVKLPENQVEEFYDIRFISDIFAVMLFFVENYEEERQEGMELDRAQFILGNIYHEILSGLSCKVYQTCISDLMVLIVNIPEEKEDKKGILDQAVKEGSEFINQHFNMGYSVCISNIHEGRGELAVAYQEALQAMECKRLYGLDDMMYYSDIIELPSTGYYYPLEVEQEFIRCIQEGNYEAAKAVYQHVIEENVNGRMISSQDRLRCLMFDLLGTILKTLNDKKDNDEFGKEMKPAKRLAACQGFSQMKETFEDILYKTCEYLNSKSGTEDKESLCKQIYEYIKNSYFDPNLSVTSIAEHFSIPPVMMSKMFRESMGEKIPVVVSEIRLEAAKKLMCQSDASLGEIAEKVGFGSVRTFTRIFKQVENCTPGQWRDHHFS